jgi:lipopolysaccharide cholinephosphotransferase
MSIYRKLKNGWWKISIIPELKTQMERIEQQNRELNEQNRRLQEQNERMGEQLHQLLLGQQLEAGKNDLRFWQMYRLPEESTEQAKQRFFLSLPRATGGMRLMQEGNAILLQKLAAICEQNGWSYWLHAGTLLGAIRHKGPVPWDDDVDIGMLRGDVEKLRALLANDPEYQVTLIYDWYAKCRQLRFRLRDASVPCFVDVMIFDPIAAVNKEVWEQQCANREQMIREMEADSSPEVCYWSEHPWVEETSEQAPYLEALFQKAIERQPAVTGEKPVGLIWGVDNLTIHDQRVIPQDVMFPLATLDYEGQCYTVPNKYMTYVEHIYGDIYQLPHDMLTHYQHVPHGELETKEMQNKMREFITRKAGCCEKV